MDNENNYSSADNSADNSNTETDKPTEKQLSDTEESFFDPAEALYNDEPEDYNSDDEEADYDEEAELERKREEARRRKKKRKKKGHGRLIFGLVLTTLIIVISILCAAYILKFSRDMLGIGKSDISIVVEIPMNSSTSDIADILCNEGIIENTYLFRFFSRVKGSDGTFVAGPHTLSPKMTFGDIVDELQTGAVDERESVNIVFPEGITL